MNEKPGVGPIFTDLYELTMAAGYFEKKMFEPATFSLFIRGYPPTRQYYVFAGLEDVLDELASYRFSESDIDYLKSVGLFSDDFITYLEDFSFTGNVIAMPEGSIFFETEPVLEVTAPIIEAQIVETFVLNTIGFQTMIASKASRCIHAAKGRPLIDFSLRRTQGIDAGIRVARSTYLAGFTATSNVSAAKKYGIPPSGTMAHSFVTAFEDEVEAFSAYAKLYPNHAVFLIDTYDTVQGAKNAVTVAEEMAKDGKRLIGVRLDSGDMADLSIKVREIFDAAGLPEVKIFASSGFDEYKIRDILSEGAEIDAFGVGTKVGVSADAPYLDIVYKMVKLGDKNVRKYSPGKITLAGEKQVFRKTEANGKYLEDMIGRRSETVSGAAPLLKTVMENGKIVIPHPDLQTLRERFKNNFKLLDDRYKALETDESYPVSITEALQTLQENI